MSSNISDPLALLFSSQTILLQGITNERKKDEWCKRRRQMEWEESRKREEGRGVPGAGRRGSKLQIRTNFSRRPQACIELLAIMVCQHGNSFIIILWEFSDSICKWLRAVAKLLIPDVYYPPFNKIA